MEGGTEGRKKTWQPDSSAIIAPCRDSSLQVGNNSFAIYFAPDALLLYLQVLDAPLQMHLPRGCQAHLPPCCEAERHKGVGAVQQAQATVEERKVGRVGGLQGHADYGGGLEGGGEGRRGGEGRQGGGRGHGG